MLYLFQYCVWFLFILYKQGYLMESSHHRPWTQESRLRCRPLRYRYARFELVIRDTDAIYAGRATFYMKCKIVNLDKELVFDAIINVRRIQHFLDFYTLDDAFYIGKLIYKIRSKFTRMVRLYMLSYNNFDEYDHNKHILHLMEIQHIAMEIDSLVEIILDYTWPSKKRKRPLEKFLPKGGTLPKDIFGTRSGGQINTKKQTFKYNVKNYDQSIMRQNFGAKKHFNGRNIENNGGGFDSDIN